MNKENIADVSKCISLLKNEKAYEIINKYMKEVPRETLKGCINFLIKNNRQKFDNMILELSNL